MLFTRVSLLLLSIFVLILPGCAFLKGEQDDQGDFDMPESVTIDLGGDKQQEKDPERPPGQNSTASQPEAPATSVPDGKPKTIQDQDSAEVLARLNKQQQKTPAARDATHEAEASKAKPEFERAIKELKKGNIDSAYSRFEKLGKQYPSLAGPIVNQAIILRKKGKHQQAYDLLQNSLLAHAKNPYLLNELGVTSRELGKFKQAQVSYETAIRIDENYAKAHYNLAVLADLYLHDPHLALSEFNVYQTLIPKPDKKVAGWIKELQRRAK